MLECVHSMAWLPIHFPTKKLCESAKCHQFKRVQRFISSFPSFGLGSIPIARSINHDDSIVLTPLTPLKRPIKQGFLVPRWSQRNKLVPTSQPEVGRGWTVLAIGLQEIIVDSTWTVSAFKIRTCEC